MEDLRHELRFAAICTLVLDVLLWGISLVFLGWQLPVPLGLLLGSAGELCNLLLLRRTVRNAVYHGKTKDFAGYLLRVLVASVIIAAALKCPQISAIAAVLPFLYPKVIFGWLAVYLPKGKKTDTHTDL